MRGEEVQAWRHYKQPGTVVSSFAEPTQNMFGFGRSTDALRHLLTGELYSILQQHSILAGTEEWENQIFSWVFQIVRPL